LTKLIAEIRINHKGSALKAKRMIDRMTDAGIGSVTFNIVKI